jgi:hypothetical protein
MQACSPELENFYMWQKLALEHYKTFRQCKKINKLRMRQLKKKR